jgi:hypothetical protein
MTTLQVHTAEQLLCALNARPIPRLELALPSLEAAEAKIWEQRLNGLLHSCGCDEGAIGLLAGLTGSLLVVHVGQPSGTSHAVAAVICATAGGATAGKLAGKLRRRRRGMREAARLAASLRPGATARPLATGPVAS